MNQKKLLHFHLQNSTGNKSTLIAFLIEGGNITYRLYGGHGASGTPFSISNIQFYKITENGNMQWNQKGLPIENLEGETLEQFKKRVWKVLENSTDKPVHEVKPVSFA